MNRYTDSDYLVTLIIITIIGFIISTAFYVYFVYLPASRIENQFEVVSKQATQVITTVNNRITSVEGATIETLLSTCESIRSFICAYNCSLLGSFCPLRQEAYPAFCEQLEPFVSCPAPLNVSCVPHQ